MEKKDNAYFFLFFKIHAFLDTTLVWIHLYYIYVLTGGVGRGWGVLMAASEVASAD